MELYNAVSYKTARLITLSYSSSFSISSKLFPKDIRTHIFSIYGLVRIADEIVDTYCESDAGKVLTLLEQEVYSSLQRQYSTNPAVQAFVLTAKKFGIQKDLIKPFFASMRMDLVANCYDHSKYKQYIYGSAEVIGLMCLKVFTNGQNQQYKDLEPGARALGSAYQKVNFLRDLAIDHKLLGRNYIPGLDFENFDDSDRDRIITNIEVDFKKAEAAIRRLPTDCRLPVKLSSVYYRQLLRKLGQTPAEQIKQQRVRINSLHKTTLLIKTVIWEKFSGR